MPTVPMSPPHARGYLSLVYQIRDHILEFTAATNVLGKMVLSDMDIVLISVTVLYADQE